MRETIINQLLIAIEQTRRYCLLNGSDVLYSPKNVL